MPTCSALRCAAFAVLGALIISCGDDEGPAAADDPCDDANTTCLNLTLAVADMTHLENYSTFNDDTHHNLIWRVDGKPVFGYGPGQHITITVKFDPPVTVRYDHNSEQLTLIAGPDDCYDRTATATSTFATASWTDIFASVEAQGLCVTSISQVNGTAIFSPLGTGDELHSVTFEFTVPPTYTDGDGAGTPVLASDLSPISVTLTSIILGDARGNPPAWPGEFPGDPAARTPPAR